MHVYMHVLFLRVCIHASCEKAGLEGVISLNFVFHYTIIYIYNTVKVHCRTLELMSRQILKQITAEESFNTRHFNLKIFINCTEHKRGCNLFRATIGEKNWRQGDILR